MCTGNKRHCSRKCENCNCSCLLLSNIQLSMSQSLINRLKWSIFTQSKQTQTYSSTLHVSWLLWEGDRNYLKLISSLQWYHSSPFSLFYVHLLHLAWHLTCILHLSRLISACSLISLLITNTIDHGDSCPIPSLSLSITTANKKGLTASVWRKP